MVDRWQKRIGNDALPVDFDNIFNAHQRLATLPYSAPAVVVKSIVLSSRYDADVYFVICTEATKSFKWRGAGNALLHAAELGEGKEGVAASAGNHAQGFVLAAGELARRGQLGAFKAISALTLVIPANTPDAKKEKIYKNSEIELNGQKIRVVNVIEHGTNFDEARVFAENYIAQDTLGRMSVPPYDYKYTIAGGGTLAIEALAILNQYTPDQSTQFAHTSRMDRRSIIAPDLLYVPSGGGGLVAGMAIVMDELAPNASVIACEPAYVQSKYAAMTAGETVKVDPPPSHIGGIRTATGISVEKMGNIPFEVMNRLGVGTQSVTHDQFSWVTNALNRNEWGNKKGESIKGTGDIIGGINSESSGSAGVAAFMNMPDADREMALRKAKLVGREKPLVMCVITGANIDKQDLDKMAEWVKNNPDFPRDNSVARYVAPLRSQAAVR